MTDLPKAMQELLCDEEGAAAKAAISTLMATLEEGGTSRAALGRALLKALMELLNAEYLGNENSWLWARRFIQNTGVTFTARWDAITADEIALVEKRRMLLERIDTIHKNMFIEWPAIGTA